MCIKCHYTAKSQCRVTSVRYKVFLSVNSKEDGDSRDHFFLSPDFHELWHSMMSICLFTEVKRQWATLVLEWVTASVHYLFL